MPVSKSDAGSDAPLIDRAIIDSLRAALGPATEQIIAKAKTVVEDRMGRIAALAEGPVSDELARTAHEIGGVSGQVGLARLSREALALERLCRDGDAPGAKAAAAALADTARRSVAAMEAG
jgi:HPt (histidine-containing phosphotransfer) domain-containing protein